MVPEAKSTRIVKAFQEDKRERGVSKAFVEVALKDWGWGDGIWQHGDVGKHGVCILSKEGIISFDDSSGNM